MRIFFYRLFRRRRPPAFTEDDEQLALLRLEQWFAHYRNLVQAPNS